MPQMLHDVWQELADYRFPPEACLVNYYAGEAKMGLHQDKDEEDFAAPVLSVSLGDTGIFRVGGRSRKDPTEKLELKKYDPIARKHVEFKEGKMLELKSGDVVVLGGEDRLAYHGIDRVIPGTSGLIPEGGRFNLTLRRVRKPE